MEVEAIGRVRHKNLVRLLGYCAEGAHRYTTHTTQLPNRRLLFFLSFFWLFSYQIIPTYLLRSYHFLPVISGYLCMSTWTMATWSSGFMATLDRLALCLGTSG